MSPSDVVHRDASSGVTSPWRDVTRLLSVLDGAGLGLWSWDVWRGAVSWSHGTAKLFGLEERLAEISYDHFLILVASEDRTHVEAAMQSIAEGRKVRINLRHRVHWPDGTERWLELDGELQDTHEPKVAVGIVRDITEQRLKREHW